MTVVRNAMTKDKRCPYCGQCAEIIWVHGHGQCSVCKMNVDECCRGETVCPDLQEIDERQAFRPLGL